MALQITSLQNPRIKHAVKLRQRSHRDDAQRMLVEGYREIRRALDNAHPLSELFFCRTLFQGPNEDALMQAAAAQGAALFDCSEPVFRKMAYRDRPEGLLAVAPHLQHSLTKLDEALSLTHPHTPTHSPSPSPLVVVAEAIEKPGNLGTILRSADAAGADAVLVCDRCTDIHNPNVVRASTGILFAIPVIEVSSRDALAWLHARQMQIVATTPHTDALYTDTDLVKGTAVVMGTEQVGLTKTWLDAATLRVRIPMLGQADSLNVASATTLLLYEAARQRGFVGDGDHLKRDPA
ncbi:MAG: RNA methyltransferase [Verrucomicrobia bacterium]|jgi:RNA methyltransferase, TrmH family|nr:RNA methyltransferase [Verrucomicrobiota bacterium]MBT7066625.1 RNA methyltransferase [Verrucomicrobiota bacterium]MBT7699749.1 RNA methyltransferase [Verrucomicrobiota bacterium]